MSEGADSVTHTHGDTLTTLGNERERDATTPSPSPSEPSSLSLFSSTLTPPPLPLPPSPTATTCTGRRPRFGTGGLPSSPYVWIDGRQLRSALAWTKKRTPRRVSFPLNDSHLVTGYLEPDNPWRHTENVNREDLIFAYKESCARHATKPLQNVLVQLENLDISHDRCEELNLRGEILNQNHIEPLEEILKRVQFNKIILEKTFLTDESSVILFDMMEYYESTRHLNISSNPEIGVRGWQACSHMIKKTESLEEFEAGDIKFDELNMNTLTRALRVVCHLQILKLENCGLSGRAIIMLVTALKINSGIRELYLADNGLDLYDAIQLGSLLRMNNQLQLLDISNNNVQDDGVRDILEGLINQVNEDKTGKGLSILILWNNRLTKKSSPYFSRIIALSKTLETLNIGQNMLTDETLSIVNESLKQNRVLLQLGMQSTELTCDGIITLAEIMETNQVLQVKFSLMLSMFRCVLYHTFLLQRIDLRDNTIQMRGMHALVNVMKKNKTITQIDLDDKPRIRIDGPLHEYRIMAAEIRNYCSQNEERRLLEESTEDVESPRHSSRLLNASSRKISLTCQTLPSPSRSVMLAADELATRMLEPKRTSGGRLRSPAPSPIPSPVASPIPSPSRNRFVVCRVSEASLRSADSSVSSSPVTPPSLGSSPSFFPNTSGGPSRFRVSVVESAGADCSSPKSVVASSSGSSVTIGFNVTLNTADSDDRGSATKMDTHVTQAANDSTTASVDTLNVVATSTKMSPNEDIAKSEDSCDKGTKGKEERSDVYQAEQRFWTDKSITGTCRSERDAVTKAEEERLRIVHTSTKELQVPAYPNEDTASMRINVVEDKALIKLSSDDTSELRVNRTTSEGLSSCALESSVSTTSTHIAESHSREQANTLVQRHKSSLEKLLSLFQHPGQFFSDSSSAAADTKSSLQENVSGMMALGDKLQQYLKEGRTKINTESSWSSEPGSLLKNRSVRVNVSQLQSLTNIFASFKLEPQSSLIEHNTKFFGQEKDQNTNVREKDLEKSTEVEIARINKEDLFNQKKNQVVRDDGNNLIGQEVGKGNSRSQERNQITENDESSLIVKENNQIIVRNDEDDLFVQENNEVGRKDEEKSFNDIKDDEKNLIGQEENQVLNDESNLFVQIKNQVVKTERDLEDQEKEEVIRSTNKSFEKTQIIEDNENVQDQGRDEIANNNEHYLINLEKMSARSSENLEDQDNRIARNDEKDSMDIQIVHINEKSVTEDSVRCTDKLQWTKSDLSDRLLPESVQSKDDFVDNLVLDSGYVEPDVAASTLPASKSTVCIDIKLMDVAGYSALELSKTDSTGCNDFISNDENRGERNDAQNLGHIERNNIERLKRDNLEDLEYDGAKVLGNNDTECLKHNDAVGGANALTARTCDTTTDSINQTSDNSFPICNIGHDRKTVDSVSTTKLSTNSDDDVGMIKYSPGNYGMSWNDIWASSTLTDDVEVPSRSLKDVDSEHLNEEVTNSMCCVVDQDRRCESIKRKEEKEELVEVFDNDACRISADHKSTSVNIKVELCESVTTNSGSQKALGEHLEGQSFMPNNVDTHRTILKETEAEEQLEDVDDSRRIDPTILVTPSYETSANLDKSDAEELIFCMTDISTDGTSIEDELSPSVPSRSSPNEGAKVTESYFELSASRTTSTSTLLIENPESMHRNSQDSDIEETVLTIDDAVVGTVDTHPLPPPRSSLQESVDSGIESECSSICIKAEPAAERTLEVGMVPKRPSRDDTGVDDDNDEYGEFTSDFLAREAGLVDNNSINDGVAHSYLNSIKCTVVSTARPVSDEDVAHSPAAVHGTSLWDKENTLFFAARNNAAQKEEKKAKDSKGNKASASECNVDDDEIDELKEVMMQLEPKYRRYANWRI
ncbi:PPR37 phosphatase, partial [Pseudoatta argentina]